MKRILPYVLLGILCISLVMNAVLVVALNRKNVEADFVQRSLDQSFQACFSKLAGHLNSVCPTDEAEQMLWVKEAEYLADRCLDHFTLTSYGESKELQGVILLLRSMALEWEQYPSGLISRELATDILEVSYRLTSDEQLLTRVYEELNRASQP